MVIKRRVYHFVGFSSLLQWWFMVGCYFYWERRETVFLFASLPLDTLTHTRWNTHSLCHAACWPATFWAHVPRPPPPGPSLHCSLCNLLGFTLSLLRRGHAALMWLVHQIPAGFGQFFCLYETLIINCIKIVYFCLIDSIFFTKWKGVDSIRIPWLFNGAN